MLKALIVDDDKMFVDNLKFHMDKPPDRSLPLRFQQVDGVYFCSEALRLVRSGIDYDLIIYDLKLPWEKGAPSSKENGMELVRQLGPLQPTACGILISGYAEIQDAFEIGRLGVVHRLIQKPARLEAIMLVAQEAILEAAEKSKASFAKLSASYHLQTKVHEAMNNLNNILAAVSEIDRLCRPQGEFVPSRSLPLIGEELENIRRFQKASEECLLSIHPVEAVRREPCDLRRIAEWCVRYLQTQSPKSGVALEVVGGSHVPATFGVREELQQMILQLARNALQATSAGGRVEIALVLESEDSPEIVLTVRDNGTGISPADLHRLFDPDFTTRPGGTGKGLFLARAFAWNHGGRIQVESTESVGTTVTVRLPVRGVQAGE